MPQDGRAGGGAGGGGKCFIRTKEEEREAGSRKRRIFRHVTPPLPFLPLLLGSLERALHVLVLGHLRVEALVTGFERTA